MRKNTLIHTTIICFCLIVLLGTLSTIYGQQSKDQSMWITYDEMVELHSNQARKILLFMEADWCSVCKQMKREVFPDPTITSLLSTHFYPVRMDIESEDVVHFNDQKITKKALSKQFEIRGTPTILFLNEDFSVIGSSVGFSDREELTALLNFIKDERYHDSSFDQYK